MAVVSEPFQADLYGCAGVRLFSKGNSVKMKNFAAGAIVFAATTILATAGDATAYSWDHVYDESGTGVTVYVQENNDVIEVCDTQANGHSASVTVDDGAGGAATFTITADRGKGTCEETSASGNRNLNEGWVSLDFTGDGTNGWSVNFLNDH